MALNIPKKIQAGDTVKFTDSVEEYKATDGWSVTYSIVNGDNRYAITSTATDDDHAFIIPASISKHYLAASYKWAAQAIKDDERYTLGFGRLDILPDFGAGPTDQRLHVEKVLQAIEATLENKATTDQQSLSINGRSISRVAPGELLAWRDKYRSELRSIINAERLAMGNSGTNKIMTRL